MSDGDPRLVALQVIACAVWLTALLPVAMLALSALAKALPWPLMKGWG